MIFARKLFLLICLVSFSLTSCSSKNKNVDGMDMDSEPGNIPFGETGSSELSDLQFKYDSFELSQAAQDIVRRNYKWLMDNKEKRVIIEGHCDERGTTEYNAALGLRRAESVYRFLRDLGVNETQISYVSYGEDIAIDPGHTEEAWAKNRRVHFSIR